MVGDDVLRVPRGGLGGLAPEILAVLVQVRDGVVEHRQARLDLLGQRGHSIGVAVQICDGMVQAGQRGLDLLEQAVRHVVRGIRSWGPRERGRRRAAVRSSEQKQRAEQAAAARRRVSIGVPVASARSIALRSSAFSALSRASPTGVDALAVAGIRAVGGGPSGAGGCQRCPSRM